MTAVLIGLVAVCAGVAAAFAVAFLRARSRHRGALAERGWLLERERQAGAAAAVDEERARIARELHDIVSHNVSVMVVQTSAAREVLAAQTMPPEAAAALEAVETTGRNALTELRNLLGLLAPPADGSDISDEPQPGLDRLSRLVDRIAFAGLPVDVRIIGEPRPLPGGIDVTAYRIVQEALTNALKHGQADHAEVEVRYADRYLRLEITDRGTSSAADLVETTPRYAGKSTRSAGGDGGGAAHGSLTADLDEGTPREDRRSTRLAGGGGRGLVGLRERVGVYGGELDARRRIGGGFRVRARIPLDPA